MDGKEGVWKSVEAFRSQYLDGKLNHLPLDVVTLAELELKLDFDASLPTDWKQDPNLRRKAAERIAPSFGVHSQVIETRFSRENLWAEPF